MYAHPGKKLLFMGNEFAQRREWNHNQSLDWHLLGSPAHIGVQKLVRDLNYFYQKTPALHQLDCSADGFDWIDCSDNAQSGIAFSRRGKDASQLVIAVCNMTPVIRQNYRIGVAKAGRYQERLNSDAEVYGGSGVGNYGQVNSDPVSVHGHENSLNLVLPPLSTVILTLD